MNLATLVQFLIIGFLVGRLLGYWISPPQGGWWAFFKPRSESSQVDPYTYWRRVDATVPQEGDAIGDRFIVTQGWNSGHMGIDVAYPDWQDPTGTPLYAIGTPGMTVELYCWDDPLAGLTASTSGEGMEFAFDYTHLDTCGAETGVATPVIAGSEVGTIGNSGVSTNGAHLHFQQRRNGTENPVTGEHIPGWRGYLEVALMGLPEAPP